MKKMTLFTLFLSSIVMLSCSNQEQLSQEVLTSMNNNASVIIDENLADTAKTLEEQKDDYLYGAQIYYSSAEAEIKRLKSQKTKLVAELENGNKKVIEEIEITQIQIEKLSRFNEYLITMKPPKPLPKPYPCFDSKLNNCIPIQNLSSETLILLGNDLIVTDVIIKNAKNQILKSKFQPVEDQFNQKALKLESYFKGEGIMYTTFKTKVVGEITIPTPVVGL